MAYRPTAKTKQHRIERFDTLLTAALAIVTKEGFQALTISHLATKVGIATGTIYKYFDSKAQLCSEVFKMATKKEVEKVKLASFPNQKINYETRLTNAVTIFADRAIRSERLAYALIAEPVDPTMELERLKYRKAYAGIFAQLINEGIVAKEFPQQNANISGAALVGVLAESLVTPLGQGIKISNAIELISSIRTFCLRAITGVTKHQQ